MQHGEKRASRTRNIAHEKCCQQMCKLACPGGTTLTLRLQEQCQESAQWRTVDKDVEADAERPAVGCAATERPPAAHLWREVRRRACRNADVSFPGASRDFMCRAGRVY